MLKHTLLGLMAAAAITACSQKAPETGTAAQVSVTNLSTAEFEKAVKDAPNRILLDVRTPGEFSSGHMAGAVNMDINAADFQQQLARLDTSQPVYVYCLSGGRSARAADVLKDMGFPAVYNMEGGMSRWRGEGRPVVMPEGEATKGMTRADFDKMAIAGKDTLVLVDFWAKWCAPCKKIMAFLPELEKEYKGKLKIVKVNYDDNTALVNNLKLDNVPYLFVFKNGKEVWKHSGFADKDQILKALNEL